MEKHRRKCPRCERFVEIHECPPWEEPGWKFVVHYRKKRRVVCPASASRTSPPMTKRFEFA